MALGNPYLDFYDDFMARMDDLEDKMLIPNPIRSEHRMQVDDPEDQVEEVEEVEEMEEVEEVEEVEEAEATARSELDAEIRDNFQKLKRELNDWEQEEMLRDLEIGRVPERRGEDLVQLLMVIGEKLGVPIKERNIVYIIRSGIRWGRNYQAAGRVRRITVRLASRKLRDALLHAAHKRRQLTTTDVGLPGHPQRIYFNERLTQINRRLYRLARAGCRNNGWRYLWVKQGRIYVRKDNVSNVYAIRNDDNIKRAFEVE